MTIMQLTERKKRILRAIIETYIATAEPVGSKAVVERAGLDVSTATIRNEMADLTEMGLLEQPHTSAGRIPSAAGYRLYVNELMDSHQLTLQETQRINQALNLKMEELDRCLERAGKMLSQISDYPVFTAASTVDKVTVKRYDLILAGSGSFILVVMLSTDEVVNKLIKLPLHVTDMDLKLLSAVCNAAMTGLTADEFTSEVLEKVMNSAGGAATLVPVIVDFVTDTLRQHGSTSMVVAGQSRLLGLPEYRDVDKAQKMLTTLDEDTLAGLPAVMMNENGTKVLVGPENVASELKDTSVVMTKFDIGDGLQGMIGVVGPTRMDYAKVTARLSYFAESLSKMFAKPEQQSLPEANEE